MTATSTFEVDLKDLQGILTDNDPAYVLAHFDEGSWLAISYVPDTAKVRDKVSKHSTQFQITSSRLNEDAIRIDA
jgi:twinfilin